MKQTRIIVATAVAFVAATGNAEATPPLTQTPVRPDIIRAIAPGDSVSVPGCRKGYSDMHVYSAGGRPFRQTRDAQDRAIWLARDGHAVAGFERVNCDWFNFGRRPVILALWRG